MKRTSKYACSRTGTRTGGNIWGIFQWAISWNVQSRRSSRSIWKESPLHSRSYATLQPEEIRSFPPLFVRNNPLVTVEGPPRSGRTRTAAGYAELQARFLPHQLTLVITPSRRDAIDFFNAFHEVRSYRDPLRLLLILEHQMEFDQISRDSISFGNDLLNDRREETAQQYQLPAHLRAAAARIRRIGEHAALTANERHALQLV